MNKRTDIFNLSDGKYICLECGETKRLQFGVCCVCGGEVGSGTGQSKNEKIKNLEKLIAELEAKLEKVSKTNQQ